MSRAGNFDQGARCHLRLRYRYRLREANISRIRLHPCQHATWSQRSECCQFPLEPVQRNPTFLDLVSRYVSLEIEEIGRSRLIITQVLVRIIRTDSADHLSRLVGQIDRNGVVLNRAQARFVWKTF